MSQIISLKCPNCQSNLGGENNSKVFFCHPCSICFNLGKDKLSKFPLLYIKPKIVKELEQLYFPFWQFECRYTFNDQSFNGEHSDSRVFHIPAFFIKNINYFGDIGYYYMKNNVKLEEESRKELVVSPADRDLKHAALYPKIYLCKEASRKRQNEFLEITVTHEKVSMVLIPFYRTEHHYFDSILFWKYPYGALI